MSTADDKRFEFGKNWRDFISKHYSQDKVEVSKQHILGFMKRPDLKGLSIIDIGCGSGLHSMAMFQAGAASIHSFDYDPNSVEATRMVHEIAGKPANWTIQQGSVLDDAFMRSLPQYDLVYSWGVLHHTGEMWKAIDLASTRVKPGGLFYIALYSADVQKNPTPEFWLDVKKKYVAGSWFHRRKMDLWYVWTFNMQSDIKRLPEVYRKMKAYEKERGMNMWTDIRDWLGGWPMEFAWDADAIKFCEARGFTLKEIATGHANTEFLFLRTA